MKIKQTTIVLALSLWFGSNAPALAAPRMEWQTGPMAVALVCDGVTTWRFNYDTNVSSKPFFHPLALPGGAPLTWQSPADHVWHYGLWFSWKYLNGVNYWEEEKSTRRSAGITSWRVVKVETRPDFSARLELELDYRPRNALQPVLTERRQIDIAAPATDGSYALDWRQEFQAGAAAVKFDRTPPQLGETSDQAYGGYAGLSLRFAKQFTNTQVHASGNIGPMKNHRYGFSAIAADYSGQMETSEMGVAFLDHPANPRHPSRWYAIVNPGQSFAFLNAAWLQLQPYELPAREKITLRYRVIVHPARWDTSRLQKEHSKYSSANQ